jgi:LysM repeat protein
MIQRQIRKFILSIGVFLILLGSSGSLPWAATVSAAAVAVPGPAAAAVADGETIHIVQRGDTLYSIARRYGVTVQALRSYNNLRSDTIYIGQRLLIPGGGPGPVEPTIHVVQRGDTLYSIARRYGTTVDAIMRANRLSSDRIYVGQRLTIPVNAPPPSKPPVTHVVAQGETLYSIARRYGTTVAAIQAINGLRSTTIYVGQRLLIPVQGTPAPTPNPTRHPTPSPGPTQETGEALIEGVEVRILESYPVQVQAIVRGQLPDACTYIEQITQVREGQTFRLRLTTARYPDRRCAQVLTPFQQVVSLNVAGLPGGTYDVRIGQIVTRFQLPQ